MWARPAKLRLSVRRKMSNLRPFSRQEARQPRDESLLRVVTYNLLADKFALGG
jgi:hypothetical protein